jgi:polysaccharide biosynthesis transport protein
MPGEFTASDRQLSPYFIQSADAREINRALEAEAIASDSHPVLWEYWLIVQRRQSLVIALVVLTLTITGLVVFTMTPVYTAESTVLIERQAPQVLDMKGLTTDAQEGGDPTDYYKTQYELLQSRGLAEQVIRSMGLTQNPVFTEATKGGWLTRAIAGLKSLPQGRDNTYQNSISEDDAAVDPAITDAYLRRLTIRPRIGTRLVVVGFSTPNPVLSAELANAHVNAYILRGMELHAQAGEKAGHFLESKLAELKNRVEKSEAALNSYRKSRGIVAFSLNDKGKLVSMRLDDLDKALTASETARIGYEAEVLQINRRDYDSLPEVVDNLLIHSLRQQLVQTEAEHASMANRFTSDYPPLAQLEAKLEDTRRRLQAEDARIVAAVTSRYHAALERERELRDAEKAETARAMAMNDSSLQDTILAREVDTSRQLYKSVLGRMREIGVESEVRLSNISIVDEAEAPRWPSAPKKLISMFLAGVLGALAGVGSAFFLDYIDQTLKSSDEAERYLGLPSLGVIPDFRVNGLLNHQGNAYSSYGAARRFAHSSPGSRNAELVIVDNPFSVASEAYRTIRTGVLLSRAADPPKIILITSASPREGKTVTAVNMALALSRLGGRILLIDADLRRPRCHEVLGCANGPGLTEILTSHRDPESLIHGTAEDLDFLSAGSIPPNPAELLGSQKMRDTVCHIAAQYDHVIFDSAPLLPVTDTILLSRAVDGVVVVVGAASLKQLVSAGCTRLRRSGAKVLGIVLNRVDVQRNPRYKPYGYYSNGYYSNNGTSLPRSEQTESDTNGQLRL